MQLRMIGIALVVLSVTIGTVRAEKDVPEKAVCRTCEVRGEGHGAEDVAAWREYDGERYYFCSQDCAEAFDGFPAAYVPQPLPRPAPNATVTALDGEKLEIADFAGRVVLLDFWATWCVPCRKTMPFLNDLHAKREESNLSVLGISIDENARDVVPKFVDKENIRYPIALDTERAPAWHAFRVAAIPAMFLIDHQGRIVAEWNGEINADDVRGAVERALADASGTDSR